MVGVIRVPLQGVTRHLGRQEKQHRLVLGVRVIRQDAAGEIDTRKGIAI